MDNTRKTQKIVNLKKASEPSNLENRRRERGIYKTLRKQTKMISDILETQKKTQESLQTLISTNFKNAAPNGDPECASKEVNCPEVNKDQVIKALSFAAELLKMSNQPSRPAFANSESQNAKIFLDEFEQYFQATNLSEDNKLNEVMICFSGSAKQWATFHKDSWQSFHEFRQDFLKHFWSIERLLKIRKKVSDERYDPSRHTMCEFFITKANQLRTLASGEIPEHVIVNDLMRLFPLHVQSQWYALFKGKAEATYENALEFLESVSITEPIF